MTATKPRIYTGEGSATDDYFNPKSTATTPKSCQNQEQGNWGLFKKDHPLAKVHKLIRSLCIQNGWSVPNEKWGEVADLEKLSHFLKSDNSPVKKPLMDMSHQELEKIIVALEGIINSTFKTKKYK